MLDYIIFVVGLIGFSLASYWDLRYTEFPDWLPYSMIISTLFFRGIFSFLDKNPFLFVNSLLFGVILLAIGLFFYFLKQWGDGDAWLLGALGFILPDQLIFGVDTKFPFYTTLIFNFLLVSLIYLIFYSLLLGIRNKKVNKVYVACIKKEKKALIFTITFFFAFSWISVFLFYFFDFNLNNLLQFILLPFILTFLLLFSYYAKTVEKELFRKKVKTSELKEGDVLCEGKWKGLTNEDIKKIKKKHRYVWIKEGVRFAPVFLITFLISIFIGDLIFILI
ncbi:MAG: A24 family peptidase [Candidatus Aenigmatarchaeota archaeon]